LRFACERERSNIIVASRGDVESKN